MKLYCFGQSGHSYKVANYLNLAGITWEPVFVDFFKGESRSPSYREINPMGEVPVFVDGDIKLTQSGVILDYLVEKTGAFAPQDARENLRWVLWDNHKMSSQAGTARFLKNFIPEEKRNYDVIAFVEARFQAALNVLEEALKKREWLVGDAISPADFSCSSYLFYPEEFGFERAKYPNIDAWLARIEAMNGWSHPYDLMPFDQEFMNNIPAASRWHK